MSKFNTNFSCDKSKFKYSINTLPSETRQSDFEPLSKLVARVMRGEILPRIPEEEFELTGNENIEDVFSRPDNWDTPGYDFGDAGSPYQDDIRQGIAELNQGSNTPNKENNPQEREQSDATSSQSDANVPVE